MQVGMCIQDYVQEKDINSVHFWVKRENPQQLSREGTSE